MECIQKSGAKLDLFSQDLHTRLNSYPKVNFDEHNYDSIIKTFNLRSQPKVVKPSFQTSCENVKNSTHLKSKLSSILEDVDVQLKSLMATHTGNDKLVISDVSSKIVNIIAQL